MPDAILRSAFRVFSPTPLGFSPQTAKHRAPIFPDVSLCFGRRSWPPDRRSGQRVRSSTPDHLQQSGLRQRLRRQCGSRQDAMCDRLHLLRHARDPARQTWLRDTDRQPTSPHAVVRDPPLDLVSETMVPREIRDERTVSYTMSPQMIVPTDHLFNRAEELRGRTHGPAAVIPPGTPSISNPPLPNTTTLPPGSPIGPVPGELPGPPPTKLRQPFRP